MILDIARLLLFPALMAFAAASDLFTMTISNRVSLALAAGFLALALLSGMGLYDTLAHIGAGAAVLAVAFACFAISCNELATTIAEYAGLPIPVVESMGPTGARSGGRPTASM